MVRKAGSDTIRKQNMKKIKCLLFTLLLLSVTASAQDVNKETSIFDKDGSSVAYIAEDFIIYLWEGSPVAYIENINSSLHVYGFNGRHLGWYAEGMMYDDEGNIIGAQKDALSLPVNEGMKGVKGDAPVKLVKEDAPAKPVFLKNWSGITLKALLKSGIE